MGLTRRFIRYISDLLTRLQNIIYNDVDNTPIEEYYSVLNKLQIIVYTSDYYLYTNLLSLLIHQSPNRTYEYDANGVFVKATDKTGNEYDQNDYVQGPQSQKL